MLLTEKKLNGALGLVLNKIKDVLHIKLKTTKKVNYFEIYEEVSRILKTYNQYNLLDMEKRNILLDGVSDYFYTISYMLTTEDLHDDIYTITQELMAGVHENHIYSVWDQICGKMRALKIDYSKRR